MRRGLSVRVACALLAMSALLALPGCFERHEPVPEHVVTVQPDINRYLLDGRPMAYDQLQTELKTIADKTRQSATGNARTYLKVITQPGASFDRSMEIIDYCASVGIDKIETTGR
jgi:biopolymer transport protein ExbD